MNKKKIFPFKVKAGAYEIMVKILKFPAVTGAEINNGICRVTVTDYSPELSLKKEYIEQYKNDQVFQIRLLDNNDREFIVLASMLQTLEEPFILSN
jgi:hypothetical protein